MMLKAGSHKISWYAGGEDFSAQTILKNLFNRIIQIGEFDRVVFFGSSGGGFASLYYKFKSSFHTKKTYYSSNLL